MGPVAASTRTQPRSSGLAPCVAKSVRRARRGRVSWGVHWLLVSAGGLGGPPSRRVVGQAWRRIMQVNAVEKPMLSDEELIKELERLKVCSQQGGCVVLARGMRALLSQATFFDDAQVAQPEMGKKQLLDALRSEGHTLSEKRLARAIQSQVPHPIEIAWRKSDPAPHAKLTGVGGTPRRATGRGRVPATTTRIRCCCRRSNRARSHLKSATRHRPRAASHLFPGIADPAPAAARRECCCRAPSPRGRDHWRGLRGRDMRQVGWRDAGSWAQVQREQEGKQTKVRPAPDIYGRCPPLPTVAPTRIPTVHSLPLSLGRGTALTSRSTGRRSCGAARRSSSAARRTRSCGA